MLVSGVLFFIQLDALFGLKFWFPCFFTVLVVASIYLFCVFYDLFISIFGDKG